MSKIIKIISMIIAIFLSMPSFSFSDSKSLCPNKILDQGTITGKYLGWFEGDETNAVGIQIREEKEPTYLVASEEDANRFFGNNKGKTVTADYKIEQYWMEEGEECSKIVLLTGGQVVSNSKQKKSYSFNSR